MRKFWLAVVGFWLLSIVYFIVYVNDPALRLAVDQSSTLSIIHGVMDILLIGGGFALIAGLLHKIFHRQ
ncbi:MAG: hypothetical protein LKJ29_02270 [Lactobacillus sp.]|uniref:DUF3923 family protein n=1 Tax=Lacticaseibacillus suilingensis TaxID=2799577 RepID=A0ABW4BDM4_9LACO|nr:hypothetical protein [Lacticaseibacillus suilingensis]MCI1893191.1 hypothetical protein [Lactobacillus sp.]MCI1940859.1 hypothetical protein [Lactobacillus sp.]MCI1971238.1 hypothetical protein [Lactobacillus sp.]MCI2037448.1 hypothetical protein [Lactobacillus sp.]